MMAHNDLMAFEFLQTRCTRLSIHCGGDAIARQILERGAALNPRVRVKGSIFGTLREKRRLLEKMVADIFNCVNQHQVFRDYPNLKINKSLKTSSRRYQNLRWRF
jgi:hypothetical protein